MESTGDQIPTEIDCFHQLQPKKSLTALSGTLILALEGERRRFRDFSRFGRETAREGEGLREGLRDTEARTLERLERSRDTADTA